MVKLPKRIHVKSTFYRPKEVIQFLKEHHGTEIAPKIFHPIEGKRLTGFSIKEVGRKKYEVRGESSGGELDDHELAHIRQIVFQHEKGFKLNGISALAALEDGLIRAIDRASDFDERVFYKKFGFKSKNSFFRGIIRLFQSKEMRPVLEELNKTRIKNFPGWGNLSRIFDSYENWLRKEAHPSIRSTQHIKSLKILRKIHEFLVREGNRHSAKD